MQFRLRTLLIVLALGPPLLAGAWVKYLDHRERQRIAAEQEMDLVLAQILEETAARNSWQGNLFDDLIAAQNEDL